MVVLISVFAIYSNHFLLFLLVLTLAIIIRPAFRADERAPEALQQRGVFSSRYNNLSFGIPGKTDCIVD
ncbi:MAG: hypothetical protein ACI4UV_08480 [Victivallales bacterium]